MIVREIITHPELLEDFDWFNDYKDTRLFLTEHCNRLLGEFDRAYEKAGAVWGKPKPPKSREQILLSQLLAARTRNLNVTDLAALILADQKPVALGQVAEILQVSPAATSGVSDKLERLSYAKREHTPQDRRKQLLTITPQGQAVLEAITIP